MGLNDMGCRPDRLPGYLPLTAENLARFSATSPFADAAAPDARRPRPDHAADDRTGPTDGSIKALWIVGANPVLERP